MTSPTNLTSVGIGKEATFGAGVAPTVLLPVTKVTVIDNVGQNVDESWRGSAVTSYDHVPTTLDSSLQLGGPVFPDGIGFPLAGLLGDVSFAAGSPNTWTMSTKNTGTQQPPSHAVTVNDPVGRLQYPGCRWSALTLTFEASGALQWAGTLAGQAGASTSNTMPAASGELMVPGWAGTLKIGGVAEPLLLSATIGLSRSVAAKRNVTGQQAPWLQRSDVLAVAGQLTIALSSDAYRQAALNGTTQTLDLTYQTGSGAGLRRLELRCSTAVITAAPRDYGQKWVEVDVAFTADANVTDAGATGGESPVFVTLKNAVGSGVYA